MDGVKVRANKTVRDAAKQRLITEIPPPPTDVAEPLGVVAATKIATVAFAAVAVVVVVVVVVAVVVIVVVDTVATDSKKNTRVRMCSVRLFYQRYTCSFAKLVFLAEAFPSVTACRSRKWKSRDGVIRRRGEIYRKIPSRFGKGCENVGIKSSVRCGRLSLFGSLSSGS